MGLRMLCVAAVLVAAGSAHASTGCELRLRPETSGFLQAVPVSGRGRAAADQRAGGPGKQGQSCDEVLGVDSHRDKAGVQRAAQ